MTLAHVFRNVTPAACHSVVEEAQLLHDKLGADLFEEKETVFLFLFIFIFTKRSACWTALTYKHTTEKYLIVGHSMTVIWPLG